MQKFTVCLGKKAKFTKSAQSRAYGFRTSQSERIARRLHGSQVKPYYKPSLAPMQMQGTRDHYLQAPYLRAKQGQRDQLESGRERRKFGKRKGWEVRNLAER